MTNARWSFRAVLVLYAAEAVMSGLLVARLPDLKSRVGLSNAAFGLVLFGIPTGTVLGFLVTARSVGRFGLTRTSWVAVLALSIASIGPALAGSARALFLAFLLYGACLGHTEVTQNSIAGHLERTAGRRVMSRCHGGWSLGSIAALLIGGALSQAAVPVSVQQGAAAVFGVAVAVALARWLPHVPRRVTTGTPARSTIGDRLPPLALLLLCLLPLGTLAVEGVVRDWGAIFLRDVLHAEPFASTLLFATLSLGMVVVRLSGDALLERLGERAVVAVSILCSALGLLAIALASTATAALVGAAVTGIGVALVYPVALSIAARRSDAPERDVATVSFVCFVVLMASPALVGVLGESFGLRATFAAFAVASLLALFPLPAVSGRPEG